jgi:hypothetical protein
VKLIITMTAVLGLFFATGCRHAHLGSNTGVAYEDALEKQREGDDAAEAPELSADDAKQVLREHRGGAQASDGASTAIVTPVPLMTTTSGGNVGGGASWDGASGNITLEAK